MGALHVVLKLNLLLEVLVYNKENCEKLQPWLKATDLLTCAFFEDEK